MKKICVILSAILIVLSGCSKSEPQDSPQNGSGSSDLNTATYNITAEDTVTFLNNYSNTMDYYIFNFASEYGSIITKATLEYLTGGGNVIADSESAVAAAKNKLDELENIEVVNGLGLSDKHSTVLEAKDNYEMTADSFIDAMKDKCNSADWSKKRDYLSFALKILNQACMDAKNQAELKLYELGAGKSDNDSTNNSDIALNEENQNIMSPSTADKITPISEEDILLSYDVLAKQVFDEYVSSEQHSQGYTYLLVGKYSYNVIEYYVIQAGTPTSMNEYYLIDNFTDQDYRNLYPQVYSAGWGGIQAESMELVYETKIPKP